VERRLRVGLIGCGDVAQRYPAAIAAGGRLVPRAVTDTDVEAGRRFAREFDVQFVPRLETLHASELDLICICTPSDTHATLAEASLEAGFDVVVEHPLALGSSEGERLCRIAASLGRRVFVVRQRRFLDSIQQLRRLLARRRLGEIGGIEAQLFWRRGPHYYESRPWRTRPENGGVVRNQASHFLDLLIYLFGEPSSVSGAVGNVGHPIPVEDSFVGRIAFAETVVADFSCTTAAQRTWTHLRLTGSRDQAVLHGKEWELLETSRGTASDGPPSGGHAQFLDRVARSLAGEPLEVVDGAATIPELRTIEAIYRTARRDDARVRAELRPTLDVPA
jgi:UDP-N-acetyl-2-amino-2-deoxyglucuronate dehydrogenase